MVRSGETVGLTPFWVLYALHDALVKPMPGNLMTPSLAESWTVSADQRVYEFKLREGLKFHNGDPFTAEDVKFSFQRAKGAKILKEKVREVEIVDPYRVRFHLHEPWPDFMTFYGTLATGAGWIVPKKYVEQVGDDGFKKHPIGLGPYKFVSHTPGIELVMEAYEGYWRKMPSVKRLVFKSVPEATTRLAMLKRGEVDLAYLLDAPQAQEVKRDPNLKLAFSGGIGIFYLDFFDQWDPEVAVADRRVRLAANHAIDRQALSEAETLGASRLDRQHRAAHLRVRAAARALSLRSRRRPSSSWPRRAIPTASTPAISIRWPPVLLDGRGGRRTTSAPWASRRRMRTMERAAFYSALATKKLQGRLRVRQRGLRQRRLAHVGDRAERRRLRLRRLSRHRRALQAAGARDRPEEARGACCTRSSSSSTSACASARSTSTSGRAASGRGWRSPR